MPLPITDSDNPLTTDLAYEDMKRHWELIRDLLGGEPAMKEAGRKWLPEWNGEESDSYAYRLDMTNLFPGFQRTVKVLTGKAFVRQIQMSEDTPEEFHEWAKNIDQRGRELQTFVRDWFEDGLAMCKSYCWVNSPSMAVNASVYEGRQAGARPYWVHVKADDLLFADYQNISGRKTLTEARIRQVRTERKGWGEIERTYVVRLFMDNGSMHYETWMQDLEDKKRWLLVADESGATDILEIPIVEFNAGKDGKPPLLDLAYTNLAHWRSTSEQHHCLSLGRRPFPALTGFSKEETERIKLGPHSAIRSGNKEARASIVESSGTALATGRQHLQDLKEEMAVQGAEMLVRKPVQKTATEAANEAEETGSELSSIVMRMQSSVVEAMRLTAMLAGIDGGWTAVLNREFDDVVGSDQDFDVALRARMAGEVSRALFFEIGKRSGIIPEDWLYEKEQELLSQEGVGGDESVQPIVEDEQ